MTAEQVFTVFATEVAGSGPITVRAASHLAAFTAELEVVFIDAGPLGQHVELRSATHVVATFPYLDHAERRLSEVGEPWEPLNEQDGDAWEDLDQSWYL